MSDTNSFTVLVCGGRNFIKEWLVFDALEEQWEAHGQQLTVVEGGARGADSAAALWAQTWAEQGRNVTHRQFRAGWHEHGWKAGPIRNQRMLDEARPDLVLAFPGGAGTADMVHRAEKAGIPVIFPCAEPEERKDSVSSNREMPDAGTPAAAAPPERSENPR